MLWKLLSFAKVIFHRIFLRKFVLVTFVTPLLRHPHLLQLRSGATPNQLQHLVRLEKTKKEKKTKTTLTTSKTTSQFPSQLNIRIATHPFTSIISTFVSQMDHAPTCICTDKVSIALKANLQIWSTNQRGSRNKGIKYDVNNVYSCGLCTCWLHISKWRGENKLMDHKQSSATRVHFEGA